MFPNAWFYFQHLSFLIVNRVSCQRSQYNNEGGKIPDYFIGLDP
jgi:hypothetical protein